MSPDQMTTPELRNLIAWYEENADRPGHAHFGEYAEKARALLAQRELTGTLDVVPAVTPRRHHAGVQQDQTTAA